MCDRSNSSKVCLYVIFIEMGAYRMVEQYSWVCAHWWIVTNILKPNINILRTVA